MKFHIFFFLFKENYVMLPVEPWELMIQKLFSIPPFVIIVFVTLWLRIMCP